MPKVTGPLATPPAGSGPLPATTPQAFAAYLNAHFSGDNGQLGGTVAGLASAGWAGATLGDQWTSYYRDAITQTQGQYTLEQYEEAFVVLWEEATLGGDLSKAATVGLGLAGTAVNAAPSAVQAANNALGGILTSNPLAVIGAFFAKLGQPGTWIRVAEVVIGGLLLLAGLNHALGNPAGKAARTAAKGAAFL